MDKKITINDYVAQVLNADFNELLELRDPPFESFIEYKDIGENEFDLIYGSWYERLSEFEPLSHDQKIALIPFDDIDDRLKSLIKRLNNMQLYTSMCCQGADFNTYTDYRDYVYEHPNVSAYYPNGDIANFGEWPNGSPHNQYAHIHFEESLPVKLIDLLELRSDIIRIDHFGERVESTKMKFNSEFHKEFDRILDEWEKLKDS